MLEAIWELLPHAQKDFPLVNEVQNIINRKEFLLVWVLGFTGCCCVKV
jgi:hypothetical protein